MPLLLMRGVGTSTPVVEATTTIEVRPTNSPLSTVPTVFAMRRSMIARIGERTKPAIEDVVAAIGDVRLFASWCSAAGGATELGECNGV